ncbi:alcohol dehydrogenase catalytic domain-containing protein [Kribbella sp. NPDC056861]|uniref:alcohol dehydrogenase catalytic domain-containing protein n=1 Tax=Kribbella sp. NPDC056861 TaxID=3154857 RepID=UPI00344511D3
MYAAVIRPERYGSPAGAFAVETVAVPTIGRRQVLVWVMAAGVNFNNVWAASGRPVDVVDHRRRRGSTDEFHIGGSDAAGVVWAVGAEVNRVQVGDEVILNPAYWDELADDIRLGADPTLSKSLQAWGYETNYGSFAQFTVVNEGQCHLKPASLDWMSASSLLCCGGTAYRQLCTWTPHTVGPGDPVLIWGGAGGLGSAAIQFARQFGARPVGLRALGKDTGRVGSRRAASLVRRGTGLRRGVLPGAR